VRRPQVHRNLHEGKIGVRCLAPAEGLGIDDVALRERWGSTASRSSEAWRMTALLTEIDHVAIAVRDLDAAVAWYARHSGRRWPTVSWSSATGSEEALLKVADSYIQTHLGDPARLPGGQVPREQRGRACTTSATGWTDCAVALAAVKAAGGRAIDEAPRPGSRGTTVAFIHPKGPSGPHRAGPGVVRPRGGNGAHEYGAFRIVGSGRNPVAPGPMPTFDSTGLRDNTVPPWGPTHQLELQPAVADSGAREGLAALIAGDHLHKIGIPRLVPGRIGVQVDVAVVDSACDEHQGEGNPAARNSDFGEAGQADAQ